MNGAAVELSDELIQLGLALGILRLEQPTDPDSWTLDTTFFADPGGALGGVLTDPVQRQAAIDLATTLFGRASQELDLPQAPAGQTWIPIAQESDGAGSGGLFAVLDVNGNSVDIGIAGRAAIEDGAAMAGSVWVPVARLDSAAGASLLLGTAEGTLRLAVGVELPPADPGDEVALEGAGLAMLVPTQAGVDPTLSLRLTGLRLPSWPTPRDIDLGDDLKDIDAEFLDLLVSLLQSRAGLDPQTAPKLWLLLTLLGLGDTTVIPALPVADIFAQGPSALRAWAVSILTPDQSGAYPRLTEWLETLGELLGLQPPVAVAGSGAVSNPWRICFTPATGVEVCARIALEHPAGVPTALVGLAATATSTSGSLPVGATVEGVLRADLDIARIGFGATPQVGLLPRFEVGLQLGSAASPLVQDAPDLAVESLSAGFAGSAAGEIAFVLEARDVTLAGSSFPVLDLTSVDAVTQAASSAGGNAIVTALSNLFGTQGVRRGQALAAVLGLMRPVTVPNTDATWPALPGPTEMFGDPLGALARYHARVVGATRWETLADEIALLLQAVGVTPGTIPGNGTAADPWILRLPPAQAATGQVAGNVDLLLWGTSKDGLPVLHVALRLTLEPIPIDDKDLEITLTSELVRAVLPTDAPDQPTATFADRHEVRLGFSQDLMLESGPVLVTAERIDALVWWERDHGWNGSVTFTDAELTVEGTAILLPNPFRIFAGQLPSLPQSGDSLWDALRALLGLRVAGAIDPDWPTVSWRGLAAMLGGWLPSLGPLRLSLDGESELTLEFPDLAGEGWPSLSLPNLAIDPLGALGDWLADLFASTGNRDFSLPSIGFARALFGDAATPRLDLAVDGAGTYEDPWRLPISEDVGAPALLAWLDPEGPTLNGLDDALAELLPDDLVDALDGSAPMPTYEQLVVMLERAARFEPDLQAALRGRRQFASALEALRERVLDGDGLVPESTQSMIGDSVSTTVLEASHLTAPAKFVLSDHAAVADPTHVVYVVAPLPGVSTFPGHPASASDSHIVDLRAPGVTAEAIDLSGIAATGPWYVLTPTRAEARVTSPATSGYNGVVARLQRAVQAIATKSGATDLTLVAHSFAGHAARAVWAVTQTSVAQLITVATPNNAAGLDILDDADATEAIRGLQRLVGLQPQNVTPGADMQKLIDLLATLGPALNDALEGSDGGWRRLPFPLEDFEPPQTPSSPSGATTPVAVTARFADVHVDRGIAALVRATTQRILDLLLPTAGTRDPVTHLGLGIGVSLPPEGQPTGPAGGVHASTRVRLDAHRVRLRSGGIARMVPRLSSTTELRREGGWLVGGPELPLATDALSARVRWAEIQLMSDPAFTDVDVRIVLHDAALYGLDEARRVIDGTTLDSVSRLLLGELAKALSPVPATGALRDALALAEATGVAGVDQAGNVTFDPDALERLVADPSGFLRTRFTDPAARAALVAALRRVFGAPSSGPFRTDLGNYFRAEIDDVARTLTVMTVPAGVSLGEAVRLVGGVTFNTASQVRAQLRAAPARNGGPAVPAELVVDADTTGVAPVLQVAVDLHPGTSAATRVELYPDLDEVGLAGRLMSAAISQLIALGLEWAQSSSPGLRAVLDAVGLLDPGPPEALRDPVGLFVDPGRWLTHPSALGSEGAQGELSPAKITALLDALGDLLAITSPSGVLPLPEGAELSVAADANALVVTLSLRKQTGTGANQVGAAVELEARVTPGPAVTTTLDARVRRVSTTGLAAAAIELEAGQTIELAARLTPTGAGGTEMVIPLLPNPPGLGALTSLAATAAEHALPTLLDELEDLATHDPQLAAIGTAIGGLGTALGLRDASSGDFSIVELRLLAQDPPGELASRFRANLTGVVNALKALVQAVAGTQPSGQLWQSPANKLRVELGSTQTGAPKVTVTATGLSPVEGLEAGGTIVATPEGLGASRLFATAVEPAQEQDRLLPIKDAFPFVELRVGAGTQNDPERFEMGLWLDPQNASPREAIVLRVLFVGALSVVHRRATQSTVTDSADLTEAIVKLVRRFAIPALTDVALSQQDVQNLLGKTVGSGTDTIGDILESAQVLAGQPLRFTHDLFDEPIERALAAAAGLADAASMDLGPFSLNLVKTPTGAAATRYGVGVSLTEPLELPPAGGIVLSVQTDDDWDPPLPGPAGDDVEIEIVELPNPGSTGTASFTPSVRVRGLGMRIASEDGPLFDFGVRLNALELHTAYKRGATGFDHGGTRLTAEGLALPVGSGSGGTNPVVGKILAPDPAGGDAAPVAPAFDPELVLWKEGSAPVILSVRAGSGPGPWWIPVQRSFGPLYIEQVGFDVEGTASAPSEISIIVDGGVSLAGLAVGVDDLSLTIPWATAANPATWKLDLAGLAVAFDGKGVAIAGGLRKFERLGGVEYSGMMLVRAADLGLTAVGSYGEFPIPGTNNRYTSMFVFAALAAPLGGPPAFFVMGIGAGVGLNRRLIVPQQMTQVATFPLVAAMDPNSTLIQNPMGALVSLGETFPPQRGAFWLAAGVRFTSFTVVESIAVLTVSISDDVEITLLGLSRAGLPSAVTPIAQIELALRARFSAREAILSVQAQLTDNSWLLNPSCRLAGGFAFVIWFRTGEFVLTLGGYHPRFNRPAHYPLVPRIGINWAVSSAIAVKGESYLALTPTCVMAGGRLEASYDAGIVRASFTAIVDAIIAWDPFFYDVTAYVGVSARVRIVIDLGWFGKARITISLSIGAEVHVWGPRLRGEAHLDLDVTTVTVAFGPGDATNGKEPVGWSAFHDKYLVAGDPSGETMMLSVVKGQLAPDPGTSSSDPDDGSAARPFRLLPEFALVSTTRTASTVVHGQTLNGPALDLGPMHKVNVTSTHTVTLLRVQSDSQTQPATPSSVVPVRDNVPEGVWRVLDGNSMGGGTGVRPAFTGAEINAVAALNQPSGVASVNRVETGTPHGLPLGVDRDPDGDLSTAMQEADDWASQQNSDPLQTATQLMATPSAALARCLGMGVRRAAAAGPSDFEIQLLAAERAAPPRLERITARVYTPLKAALKIDSIAIEPPQQWEPPEVEAPLAVAVLRPAAPVRPRFGRTTVGKWGARMPRRHPLNLVTARAGTEPIATQLHLAPARVDASTAGTNIVGRDRSQRFARVGTTLELRRTFEGSARSATFLDGLQAALDTGAPLRAGQVHVWHFLRAAEDTRKNRPSLSVTGNQAVRFVALDRVGGVLVDKTIDKEDVSIPKGTHRVAVIGTGTDPMLPARGMAGWHAGATVLQVQSDTYLVAGGVLRATSPDTLRRRRPVDTALVSGSVAVRGRGISETELPGDTSCVLVALRPRPGADPAAAELLLGLDGTKQVPDSTGEPLPPLVVIEGDRVHLLYAVVPLKKEPVTVSVGRDEDWMLEGVLGSPRSPESVARWLVELGIDGLAAALADANNLRSTVTWTRAAP